MTYTKRTSLTNKAVVVMQPLDDDRLRDMRVSLATALYERINAYALANNTSLSHVVRSLLIERFPERRENSTSLSGNQSQKENVEK